jgi:hypothetical protein
MSDTHVVEPAQCEPAYLQTLKDSVGAVRDVAFIVAIYAFFTGFVYRYYYLDRLGVPSNYDDKALFSIFVYAYTVAQDYWNGFLNEAVRITPLSLVTHLAQGLFLLALSFATYTKRSSFALVLRERPWTVLATASMLAFLSFPVLAHVASRAAIADADAVRSPFSTAKSAAITLTQDARAAYDPQFVDFIQHSYAIQLISQTPENDYFLQVDNGSSSVQHAFVFAIPREHIARVDALLPDINQTSATAQGIHP